MPKSFTEHERSIIRENLILACKECWNRYGYQKTNIRELASRANISTGSFYQFYASKELLFLETAQIYEKELIDRFHSCMAEHPGKRGLAEAVKETACAMSALPWFMSMMKDWPVILRKLPPGFMERDFLQGMSQMEEIIAMYDIKPRLSAEKVTRVFMTLITGIFPQSGLPRAAKDASDYIIDLVVDGLFE